MTSASRELPKPGSFRAWVLACRPATLSASSVPVLVGTACAFQAGGFELGPALAALVGAGLLQIGSNFANDVFDYEKGADTEERLGPTRAVQAGLVSPRGMKRGMWLVFGLALLVGIYLTWIAGPVIIVIGLCSIAAAIAYTGGPYPLGYHGLGDVFVMLFFGFVAVLGTIYVQLGALTRLGWIASVPVGALATAILVVNNVRDCDTDRIAGKRTLAVRFGKGGGVAEYVILYAVSYLTPPLLYLGAGLANVGDAANQGIGPEASAQSALEPWVMLPWLALPLAIKNVSAMLRDLRPRESDPGAAKRRGVALNETLVRTAKHLAIFGLLFAVGLTLSRI
ncbi:MAG: 1,4-dihydroxy-2-naphthoate polyprenyltransferase [Myxococcales bacterium]|nr:1,4-dihydroxy-2-naphthoate polyprenyltransferase [Myxococcales bacterium]